MTLFMRQDINHPDLQSPPPAIAGFFDLPTLPPALARQVVFFRIPIALQRKSTLQ